jgi:hypothetical protein
VITDKTAEQLLLTYCERCGGSGFIRRWGFDSYRIRFCPSCPNGRSEAAERTPGENMTQPSGKDREPALEAHDEP